MKKLKLLTVALFTLLFYTVNAQSPSFGTTGFNNSSYDQVPFASGSAYPSVMTATNVANTYWNFHIGAVGVYVITQVDKSTSGAYDGAITASNVTPNGFPVLYQTFAFSTPGLTKFKLNSVKVRIYNSSSSPVPMLLAGVVGTSAGSTTPFLAMPGSNWYTINTSTDPNFYNINGVIAINGTGSTAVGEMAYDDIDISTAVTGNPLPTFTSQPTDKTICSAGTTTFSATATNAASYFWLMSSDGLIWNPITVSNAGTVFSGYNSNTLTVNKPSTALNGLYISLTAVNSTGGNQSSNAVRLYVTSSPNAGTISGPSSVCVGSNITLTNNVAGGAWSVVGGRATINSAGVATGSSAGTTSVKYTVGNGSCLASTTMLLTVNSIPAIPAISFAPGTTGISGNGGYCINKTFTLVGTPSGGSWLGTGGLSINSSGIVTIGSVPGPVSVRYTYTDSKGCSNSRTISSTAVACGPRGIMASSNDVNKESFSLYPNPTNNFVNINLKNITANTKMTIIDMFGKVVQTKILSLGSNQIDVTKLAKGTYIVNILGNNIANTQKLVIE